MFQHGRQHHELEGQGWQVMMEEENAGDKEVRKVMDHPSYYQKHTRRQPMVEWFYTRQSNEITASVWQWNGKMYVWQEKKFQKKSY